MKAITVHAPWGWAISHAGKDVENRTWRTPAANVGQRIAIHQGRTFDRDGWLWVSRLLSKWSVPEETGFLHQAIVATAVIDRIVVVSDSPWFFGPYGWVLRDVIALPNPVRCRGAQGLWSIPPDVYERIPMEAR